MSFPDPASNPDATPPAASKPSSTDTTSAFAGLARPLPPLGWLMATALVAGLLAGVVSWLIGEGTLRAWMPRTYTAQMMGQTFTKVAPADQAAADFKNATLAFAVLGGVLGAALGIAGGAAGQSPAAGTKAAFGGLVLGAMLGAGASRLLLPVYFRALDVSQEALSRDLTLPLLVHGGIWAACGLAGGLAFGLGLGAGPTRIASAALGGLVGAALGAALYEMIGAAAFPTARTTSPLPNSWHARLLARFLVATLTALLAAVVIHAAAPRSESHDGRW
jgi:hypothetical protein